MSAPRVILTRVTVTVEGVLDTGAPNGLPVSAGPVTYLADDWAAFDLEAIRRLLEAKAAEELPAPLEVVEDPPADVEAAG